MPELVVLIGLQASGKSSFYRERFGRTHAQVSKDLMVNVRRKSERQARLIEEALRAGRSVVVDNTNPSAEVRAPLIELAHSLGARVVAYYFEPDMEGSLRRNAARAGRARVPEAGIYFALKRFEAPSYGEGFDRIYRVRLVEGGFEVSAA